LEKKRAEHKRLIIESKKECWIEFTSTFNSNTPSSTIYENIRKIKGKEPRKINILREGDRSYSTIQEIAEKFAEYFSDSTNEQRYDREFQQFKEQEEQKILEFGDQNDEYYNKIISKREMDEVLQIKKKTQSTGPDNVSYAMIQNMPEKGKAYCLNMFNKFLNENFFPKQWKDSIILPFPKANKDHSNPANYRPISLTSCICKVMEKIMNNRLRTYLEMNKIVNNIQCGGTEKRSTEDHLVRMEVEIRKAFVNSEHFVAVMFDIEKAYDNVWKYGLMRDLYEMGMRGNLPKYIQNFLTNRTFKVKINQYQSERKEQQTGIPQGSVLSVTLFIIKINKLSETIPKEPGFHAST
jgi:hypothetical protein